MQDHDRDRGIEGVPLERQVVRIRAEPFKIAFPEGSTEHLRGNVQSNDGGELREETRETAGARAQVEDPLAGPQSADFLERREPVFTIERFVRPDRVVVGREARVIHGHETPKSEARYEDAEAATMTIAEFSVTPIGKGVSVGEYIARCLELVDKSGLPYKLNPMGTVVEGPFDDVLDLIARCHQAVMSDCERVSTIIKIDDRKGVEGGLEAKIADVERRLGRKLRT